MNCPFSARWAFVIGFCLLASNSWADPPPFKLAPAVAVEAEDFAIEQGWRVVKMGEGNYSVDIIGFSHAGGERFLSADAADKTAAAHKDITVPIAGAYRLWVRYEYMPFSDTRFSVAIEQGGKVLAEKMMGARDNPRWAFGETTARPQYDPAWGNEGLDEEVVDVPNLAAGPARIILKTVDQPQVPGLTANRNIDLVYLSSDLKDTWREHYKEAVYYPILDAFRETYGPRYEVQFTNRSDKPITITTFHYFNRNPFYQRDDVAAQVKDLAPGATSAWLPMPVQDVSHFGMTQFTPANPQAFNAAVRPVGASAPEETIESTGEPARFYIPPYPGKGDKAINVMKEVDAVLKLLKETPAPGKVPTKPLCFGGWAAVGEDSAAGREYAQVWAAMGMRCPPAPITPVLLKNLQAVGLTITGGVASGEYRYPPTKENIAATKTWAEKLGVLDKLRFFDFGDEIAFREWVQYMVDDERAATSNKDLKPADLMGPKWRAWLAKNRPGFKPEDYWRDSWGKLDAAQLKPDSTADAAHERPRLYFDSALFYEDAAIEYVAKGTKAGKAALGENVLFGANYSVYPFYVPHTTMYVKWFRDGAADFGRHSEYFWQLGQITPFVNGYVSEHFRCGMRFNPNAIVKQYTMPHSPGNTDGDFRRTAFTHLAHGVKNLDFFAIGMNENFTENHIDHRDHERFRAIRDITHSIGLVEDVLEQTQAVPSSVGLLVSESTEKWDWADVAADFASSTWSETDSAFRKVRLSYHQDRVGIYTALAFAGESPDLLIERDLNADLLKGYKVLYLVGDSIPSSVVPALKAWVEGGGVLFATAGVGRYGMYREPNPQLQALLGIDSRQLEEKDRFIRTAQELPLLKQLSTVTVGSQQFPALAINERITPSAGAKVIATFDDKTPAVISRDLGKGHVFYAATLPGLAYLYKGLTTPTPWVADRAAGAHRSVNTYDAAAAALIMQPLASAGVSPNINTNPGYIDTRLLRAKNVFVLPLSNYNEKIGSDVIVKITPPTDAGKPVRATSAFGGKIDVKVDQGAWTLTVPKLGFGDIVRIESE